MKRLSAIFLMTLFIYIMAVSALGGEKKAISEKNLASEEKIVSVSGRVKSMSCGKKGNYICLYGDYEKIWCFFDSADDIFGQPEGIMRGDRILITGIYSGGEIDAQLKKCEVKKVLYKPLSRIADNFGLL